MVFCVEQNINKTYICSACRQTIQMANRCLALFAFGNLKLQFSLPPLNPTKLLKQRGFYYIFAKAAELEGISICHRIYSSCFPCSEDLAKWDCEGLGCWHCSTIPIQTCFFWICTNITKHNFPMNDECHPKSSQRLWAYHLNGFLYWGVRFIRHHYIFA